MQAQKSKRLELVPLWRAILAAKVSDSPMHLQKLLDDAHYHLESIRASPRCNQVQVNGLTNQIARLEFYLKCT